MLKSYNLEYCKKFSEAKLRKMYNGEKPEVLEALIKATKTKAQPPKKDDE